MGPILLSLLCVAALGQDDVSRPSIPNANYIMNGVYVGNVNAAADMVALKKCGVGAVLNVAWDLDIKYTGLNRNGSHWLLQYNKVALVDGPGNNIRSLAAAVFALHQLLTPRSLSPDDEDTFPQPVTTVLLHCHSGQSRSVTVAALYIYFMNPSRFSTYDAALAFVRDRRHNTVWPELEVTALARELAKTTPFSLFAPSGAWTPPAHRSSRSADEALTVRTAYFPDAWLAARRVTGPVMIGSSVTARLGSDLATFGQVTAVLNVAWDVDIVYDSSNYTANGYLTFQHAKVGLVNGPGNTPTMLAAAVLQLDQMARPRGKLDDKDAATFVQPVRNVLLHDGDGRNQAIVVAALYLHYVQTSAYPTFDDALQAVKKVRGMSVTDTTEPNPHLVSLATSLSRVPILSVLG